jgi:hypothetical protein
MFASSGGVAAPEMPIPAAEVQREVDTTTPAATDLAVDAAPAPISVAAPTSPAPSAATTAGPAAGVDLEEMARRLFDPLSARLRAELWLDRERAGLVTDLRP